MHVTTTASSSSDYISKTIKYIVVVVGVLSSIAPFIPFNPPPFKAYDLFGVSSHEEKCPPTLIIYNV